MEITKFRTIFNTSIWSFPKVIPPRPSIYQYSVQYTGKKKRTTHESGFQILGTISGRASHKEHSTEKVCPTRAVASSLRACLATTVQFRSPMHCMAQFSFAREIRAGVVFDNKGPSLRMEMRGKALTSIPIGSLVIGGERG